MKIYDDLYTFYICATLPSFSIAAKKMDMDQSSLSCAISRLEKKIGKKLFIRKRTGLELTDQGLFTYQGIAPTYSNLCSFVSSLVGSETKTELDELKILTTTGTLSTLIVDVICAYKKDFPEVRINMQTVEGPVEFCKYNADIGILPTVVDVDKVTKKKIATVHSQLFCSDSYINQHGKPTSLEDLKDHKFIGYYNSSTGYKGDVDWHLRYSATGMADLKINLASAQIYAAKKGLGILAIPREFPIPKRMTSLFPEISTAIDIYAISRRKDFSKPIDKFIEYVKFHIDKERIYQ